MKIFLNLLPPERKKAIVRKFYWRFFLGQWFLVFLISLLAVGIMGALFFRVVFEGRYRQQAGEARITTEHQLEYARYEEKFDAANRSTQSVNTFLSLHTSFSELLKQLEEALPPETVIERISTQDYKIFLTGMTNNRDTFLLLQENLKKNTCFTNLNTPLSNLFSEKDVHFEIDFLVKSECLRGSVPKL